MDNFESCVPMDFTSVEGKLSCSLTQKSVYWDFEKKTSTPGITRFIYKVKPLHPVDSDDESLDSLEIQDPTKTKNVRCSFAKINPMPENKNKQHFFEEASSEVEKPVMPQATKSVYDLFLVEPDEEDLDEERASLKLFINLNIGATISKAIERSDDKSRFDQIKKRLLKKIWAEFIEIESDRVPKRKIKKLSKKIYEDICRKCGYPSKMMIGIYLEQAMVDELIVSCFKEHLMKPKKATITKRLISFADNTAKKIFKTSEKKIPEIATDSQEARSKFLQSLKNSKEKTSPGSSLNFSARSQDIISVADESSCTSKLKAVDSGIEKRKNPSSASHKLKVLSPLDSDEEDFGSIETIDLSTIEETRCPDLQTFNSDMKRETYSIVHTKAKFENEKRLCFIEETSPESVLSDDTVVSVQSSDVEHFVFDEQFSKRPKSVYDDSCTVDEETLNEEKASLILYVNQNIDAVIEKVIKRSDNENRFDVIKERLLKNLWTEFAEIESDRVPRRDIKKLSKKIYKDIKQKCYSTSKKITEFYFESAMADDTIISCFKEHLLKPKKATGTKRLFSFVEKTTQKIFRSS